VALLRLALSEFWPAPAQLGGFGGWPKRGRTSPLHRRLDDGLPERPQHMSFCRTSEVTMPDSPTVSWSILGEALQHRREILRGSPVSTIWVPTLRSEITATGQTLQALYRSFWTNPESSLCPKTYKKKYEAERYKAEKYEAEKRAEVLELYNSEFSPMHRLPEEIMLGVVDRLAVADALSLQLSCRRCASLVWRVVHNKPAVDKKELKIRVARDRYYKLAATESSDIEHLSELVCSYCRVPHPTSMFQEDEARKSLYVRRCNGIKAKFCPCAHLGLTYEEVLAGLASTRSIICPKACYGYELVPFITRSYRYSVAEVFCLRDIIISNAPSFDDVLRADVARMLSSSAQSICPHMRTDNPEFMRRIYDTPTYDNRLLPMPISNVFAPAGKGSRLNIRCLAANCDTRLEVERASSDYGGRLVVRVHHYLGNMSTPRDPK
jgi:hypothetical protein